MTLKETVQMEAKYQQEQKRAIDLNNHYMKIRKAINIACAQANTPCFAAGLRPPGPEVVACSARP